MRPAEFQNFPPAEFLCLPFPDKNCPKAWWLWSLFLANDSFKECDNSMDKIQNRICEKNVPSDYFGYGLVYKTGGEKKIVPSGEQPISKTCSSWQLSLWLAAELLLPAKK